MSESTNQIDSSHPRQSPPYTDQHAAASSSSTQHSAEQRQFQANGFPCNPDSASPAMSTTTEFASAGSAVAPNEDDATIGDPQQDLQILLEPTERPLGRPNRGALRHLKKLPQPHMCIKDRNGAGDDLYINVMSWTRIMMPPSAEHPIPLFGGMRVPTGNSRSPQNIYAVMVNPDILKHVSRNCDDPEEKCALVELMSDFVEAMNPGLGLARCPEILKDRDLTGELKDIWGAVQAQRDRDKDGQKPTATPLYGAPAYYRYSNDAMNENMTYVEFGPNANGKPADGPPQLPPTVSAVPIAKPAPPVQPSVAFIDKPTILGKTEPTANGKPTPSNEPSKLPVATKVQSAPIATVESVDDTDAEQQPETEVILPALTTTTSASSAKASTPPDKPSHTSTKKDKLVGFLPNGCHNIFPFIKSKNGSSKKDKKAAKEVATKSAATGSPVKVGQNGTTAENGSFKTGDATKHEPFVVGNGKTKFSESNGIHSSEAEIVADKLQKIKL